MLLCGHTARDLHADVLVAVEIPNRSDAEDVRVRANRLALLGALQRLFLHIANLSRLPG